MFSKENLLSVILALILASALFFGLRSNFDRLQANISGTAPEQQIGDVVVTTYQKRVELSANKNIENVDALSAMVFWNEEEVSPDIVNAKSDGNIDVTDESTGRANIFVNQLSGLSPSDTVFSIPVQGDSGQFTVSDVVLLFKDGSSERASIGMQ